VFPIDESDEELGAVYEARGYGGVHKLLEARAAALHLMYDELHIRYAVAKMFGISPGDLDDPWLG
jgi:hypothetical protein